MLVPKLRFKREDGTEYPEWEEKAVIDVATLINGRAYKSEEFQKEGKYLILRVGNLFTNETVFYSDLELESDKYIDEGDLIYAWSATFGARIYHGEKCIYHYHIWKVIPKDIDKKYLLYVLNYDVQFISSELNGGTMHHLTKSEMEKRLLFIPAEIEEQQKIADLLSNVDEVIAQSEAEVQNLEQQKKSAMQKIFSQEVRFKRDDGTEYPEWEETTIGEYCDILDNMRKPITKKDREAGIYPYYGSTNIQDYVSGYIFDEPLVLLGEDAAPFMDFRNKPIAQFATGKYWVNNHAHCLRPHGNVKFFYYSVVHKDIREYINNPERAKLNQEDMINIPISLPHEKEQQKIADFLSAYDEAISYARQELDKWKELKKGLLQQMFV